MSDRARFESQIKHYETMFGNEFEDALTAVAFRNGLSWFTNEQIAEIRAEMIEREWFSHKINRENRKRLQARQSAA